MKSRWKWGHRLRATRHCCTAVLLLAIGASACTSLPQEDRAPRRPPDVSAVPDAVPRYEPPSRYGNPASYEVFGKTYYVLDTAVGYKERGVASWYGEKFHGRRTSSGEPYDMYAMTAAHKSLPLPSYVRVTNLRNKRSAIVRVNDRGPFVHNRIIDLSYTAADRLGLLENGTGLVEVEALNIQQPGTAAAHDQPARRPVDPVVTAAPDPPLAPAPAVVTMADQPAPGQGELYVQIGAFADPLNADSLLNTLKSGGFEQARVMAVPHLERMVYRVRIGPLSGIPELDQLTADLAAAGIDNFHLAYE